MSIGDVFAIRDRVQVCVRALPRHTSMHFSVGDAVPVDVYVGPYELPERLGLGVKVRGIAVMTV